MADDWDDVLRVICPSLFEEDAKPAELPEIVSPKPLGQMSDDEIRVEIHKAIEGKDSSLSPRARHLALHILEKGWVTPSMERRKATHGEHVWQAKSELGQRIPINSENRHPESNEAMYQFDFDQIRKDGAILRAGDIARELTAKQKREVRDRYHDTCVFCHTTQVKLQFEHFVPFLVGGNHEGVLGLCLACAPCNRRKGHYCERLCPNWQARVVQVCKRCFWGSPDDYDHIAMQPQRVVLEAFSEPEEIARFIRAREQRSAREALLLP